MAESISMESDQVTTSSLVIDRSSLAKICETCEKKERYKVINIEQDTPNPARLLLIDDSQCVLVRESKIDSHCYLLFKCSDFGCLLNNMKSALTYLWIREQQRRFDELVKRSKSKPVIKKSNRVKSRSHR